MAFFSTPLLYPSILVVSRLDIEYTRNVDPDGPTGPLTQGYDPHLREPIPYEDTSITTTAGEETRQSSVRYKPKVRIPCQVETVTFEELNQMFGGDNTLSEMRFVLHNKDLRRLGLWTDIPDDGSGCTGNRLKKNDRIDAIEVSGRPGVISVPLAEPLYIKKIDPGSWGMGKSGQDLQIVWTANRPEEA